jgi:hypothetical protein
MSELIFTDAFLALEGYDISGTSKGFPFKVSAEIKDSICFKPAELGSSDPVGHKRFHGTEDADLPVDGYLDYGGNWEVAESIRTARNSAAVLTFGASRTPGDLVFLYPAIQGEMSFGGPVGDLVPFASDYKLNGKLVDGVLFSFGVVSAEGASDGQELGPVGDDEFLHAHFHVVQPPVAITHPFFIPATMPVTIETSALGDFTDAVTLYTYTTWTSRGGLRVAIPGPVTDTHYRFAYDPTGSFMIRAAAGIGSR